MIEFMKAKSSPRLPLGLIILFGLSVCVLIGLSLWSISNDRDRVRAVEETFDAYELNESLTELRLNVRAAETGQRGFLIAHEWAYREPYEYAVHHLPEVIARLEQLTQSSPVQRRRVEQLVSLVHEKMSVLKRMIDLADANDFDSAMEVLRTQFGLHIMDRIDLVVRDINRDATRRLNQYKAAADDYRNRAKFLRPVSTVFAFLILVSAFVALVVQARKTSQAEADLRASNRRLEELNGELKSFAYSVAHDLRLPLRNISMLADSLLKDHSDDLAPKVRQSVDRIIANGNRMSQLIEDLLALSRVSVVNLSSDKIDMFSLIREVSDELLTDFRQDYPTAAWFEVKLMESLPPATGDYALIRQVWVNLISNAIKFTRYQERPRIEIGAASAGREFVTYYVRDNGAGFDMRQLGRLFGPFQRLHSAAEFEGTGIGLALAQRIIQRHGGTIWAESRPGEGARFAFTLPEWVGGR